MPPTRRDAPPDTEEKDSGIRKLALIGGMSKDHTIVYVDGAPTIFPRIDRFKVGQHILVDPASGFFEKPLEGIELPSMEMLVKEVLDETRVRADIGGASSILIKSRDLKLEEGDHIAVDLKSPIIIKKLPKPLVKAAHDVPSIPWDSIIGQDEAVSVLREIGDGFSHEELAKFFGRRAPRGVMLFGPPGCGKTLLAKALATALDSKGFFTLRGPEILSKWVGQSEQGAREFFESGELYHRKTGKKAVLFIDEADALLAKRGSEHHSVITDTLVPQFLTLMDGMTESSAIVILATNRPDQLDPAVVREGRIDKKIQVRRPTPEIGAQLLAHYFQKRPLTETPSILASTAIQLLSSAHLAKIGPTTTLRADHYLSGALCEMLVEESATVAYHRNIKDKVKGKPSGINPEDVDFATRTLVNGLVNLDHSNVIYEHGLR